MQARRIEPRDMAEISAWHRQREIMDNPDGWLPPTGYWVPGTLAAWLYKTDSKIALIDGVIANPSSNPEQRRRAMHLVGDSIAQHAKGEGFLWLKGLTRFDTVARNSTAAGYRVSEPVYMAMLLELREGQE